MESVASLFSVCVAAGIILATVLVSFTTIGVLIMASVQDVNAALADLTAAIETSNGKADQLIALVTQLRDQGGATPAQLDEVLAQVAGMKASVDTQGSEDDTVLSA